VVPLTLFIPADPFSRRGSRVRLRFQKKPWDLIVALSYTTLVSAWILATGIGTLWALLLVFFFPGYVLVAALFPSRGLGERLRALADEADRLRDAARSFQMDLAPHKTALAQARDAAQARRLTEGVRILESANETLRRGLEKRWARSSKGEKGERPPWTSEERGGRRFDWIERFTLSFGLSIALVSLLGILLDLTPFGIRFNSIVATLLIFTLGVGALAIRRRMRLPVEDRLSVDITLGRPEAPASSAVDKILAVVFATSIIFAAAVVVYVAVTPRPQELFTQFFLLDRNGTVDPALYPTRLNVSQPGTVVIVVVNNESAHVDYGVYVDLVGMKVVTNATNGLNQTVELSRSTIQMYNVSLDDRGTWEQPFTFAIGSPGLWEVDFLLIRAGNFPSPYRHVFFFANVTAPA